MFHTFKYKTGYIHTSYAEGTEVIRVQVDGFAYSLIVKSVHAAKIIISKHLKKIGG